MMISRSISAIELTRLTTYVDDLKCQVAYIVSRGIGFYSARQHDELMEV